MDPNFSETHLYLGWLYEAKGEMEKAISEFQKTTFTEAPHRGLASLGYVYAITGEKEKARRALAQLQDFSNGVQKFAYEMAIIHAGLGNRNQALQLLRQASDQREWVTSCMSVDPELAILRSDPRFRGLLRQIGLTQ
jgi:Flp pilus assembly protein TadD